MDENLPADSIVPIAVVIDERTGYTLWAPPWEDEDGEEWQAFLGTGERIHLFTTPGQLAHFISTETEHDLADHPAWPAVMSSSKRQLTPDEDYLFDLDAVYDLAAGGPDRWSVGELADTVDMVERMAESCDVEAVEEHLAKIPGLGLLDSGHDVFTTRAGDKAWTEIAAGLGEHWEPILEALADALKWVEPAALDDDEDDDDEDDDDEDDDDTEDSIDDVVGATVLRGGALVGVEESSADSRAATEFWESVGILPVRLVFPEGSGLTLRCYVEDTARFLGSELTVDVFRTPDGLSTFVEEGEPNDLATLSTWGAVVEADADPIAAAADSYDFAQVSDMLDGTADSWDLALLVQVAEAALDLAEYCHLTRVSDLLSPDTELGAAIEGEDDDADDANGAEDGDGGDGSGAGERPAASDVAVLAEQWNEVVAEISTCLRWHD